MCQIRDVPNMLLHRRWLIGAACRLLLPLLLRVLRGLRWPQSPPGTRPAWRT
jgi:hypothetical protein